MGAPLNHLRKKVTICIVDDDVALLRALTRLLGTAAYRVVAFSSTEDLLASTTWRQAACFVIDIHLGRNSGIELYRKIAAEGLPIPAIFITAYDHPATRKRAMHAGGVDYVLKPFREGILLEAIGRAIRDQAVSGHR